MSKFFNLGRYVVDKAVRALPRSKKVSPEIKSVPRTKLSIKKSLEKTKKDEYLKRIKKLSEGQRKVDEGTKKGLSGRTASQSLKQSVSKTKRVSSKELKDTSYKWDKLVSDRKKADKKLVKQTIGGGAAIIAGTVGAHEGAKRKWPKYKKFMESDIKTVDGRLKIVPKDKK